jgi:tRNA(Arg) A34 adenosine deaminase TadA
MRKPEARTLVIDLLDRSVCSVQVAAVLYDAYGIFAWGWNSVGNGFGQHAEIHALSRANRRRLPGSTLVVAGRRRGNVVPSPPCPACRLRLTKVKSVQIQDRSGRWV